MNDQPIRLMHYDPRWRQEYEQTRSSLLHSCAGWLIDVQHVGSTAISGLIARPTIDVFAIVQAPADVDQASLLIEGLNFRHEELAWCADEAQVMRKPRDPTIENPQPTHRVFLVDSNSQLLKRSVAVRDLLRSDRELSLEFEEAKVGQWQSGGGDAISYASLKNEFFLSLHRKLGFD